MVKIANATDLSLGISLERPLDKSTAQESYYPTIVHNLGIKGACSGLR